VFLFDDPSIREYLNLLAKESRRLQAVTDTVERGFPVDEVQADTDKRWTLLGWFVDQEKVCEEKFAPYLRLKG